MRYFLRHPLAMVWLVPLLFAAVQTGIVAGEKIRPFISGSLDEILDARKGKPFVLVFWSLDCQYCPTELKMLGDLKRDHGALDVVVIATDPVSEASRLAARMRGYGLGGMEQWAFAEDVPERLRFAIDNRWYGEVPRTYFYDHEHRRQAKTGLVSRQFLEDWLARNAASGQGVPDR